MEQQWNSLFLLNIALCVSVERPASRGTRLGLSTWGTEQSLFEHPLIQQSLETDSHICQRAVCRMEIHHFVIHLCFCVENMLSLAVNLTCFLYSQHVCGHWPVPEGCSDDVSLCVCVDEVAIAITSPVDGRDIILISRSYNLPRGFIKTIYRVSSQLIWV